MRKLIRPFNFVGSIPLLFIVILMLLVIWGVHHIYFQYDGKTGKQITFGSLNDSEKQDMSIQVSVKGEEAVSEDYKFVKRIRTRKDDLAKEVQNEKKFFVWESVSGFNAKLSKVSKDIETLSCENKKGDDWSDDKTRKTNAWCSLIGSTYEAVTTKSVIRRVVNSNKGIMMKKKNKDESEEYEFAEGNNELFELPPYDFLKGLRGFDASEKTSKISNNGEYTLSIYPSVQESMFRFMSDNNMVGSVFAYRPSNGDIYCMASTPGWTEREYKYKDGDKVFRKGKDDYYYADRGEKEELPKDGAQMNKNLYSFTPGSTMKPLTFLVLKDQGKNLDNMKFTVTDEDKGWGKGDSYYLKHGDKRAIHCSMHHGNKKEQSASDGLGNSCNSFFAKSAEELDLKEAKKTLEDMGFFVEEYEGDPKESTVDEIKKRYTRSIDNIPYNQNALPLEKTMEHSRRNVQNFIGEGNLLVSPIDMAVFTALFGKLSKDKNSKVYFPRIWLPADETKRKEGFPELLLTGNDLNKGDENSTEKEYVGQIEKEHIAKLSEFVSTRKDAIVEVGKIWKTAYNEHYRVNNKKWPAFRHLDKYEKNRRYGLTSWSQWIDMAKTGTVDKRPDETDPEYGCKNQKYSYNLEKERYECVNKLNRAEHRTQRTLSLYSEELDLAAYIVIENYDGVCGNDCRSYAGNSRIKLDATSMMLTRLVAEALGKELDDTKPSRNEKSKKEKEEDQWNKLRHIPGINCSTCPKEEQR